MKWKCPKCGSTDLKVLVDVWAKLKQDDDEDNFETEIVGDQGWDSESAMHCRCCEYQSRSGDFKYEKADEIYIIDSKDKATWDTVENYVYDHLNPRDLDIDWTSQDFQPEGLYLCIVGGVIVPRHVYDPNGPEPE